MRLRLLTPLLLFLLVACSASPAAGTSVPIPSSPPPASEGWQPAPGLSWQWQLDGDVDTFIDADVYDVDLYVDPSVIDALHARGARVICYISVGSYEDWRPDADQFPAEVLGRNYSGWPGEKWLDIRRMDLLAPIMSARLDLCATKHFDAVEPDNIDLCENATGFPITCADQLAYARWLSEEAHARGLAIGLKNAPAMVADSLALFDFAITEDAFSEGWAADFLPFIAAGKPVFAAEYTDTGVDFEAACAWGKQHAFSFILKDRNLGAFLETCQ